MPESRLEERVTGSGSSVSLPCSLLRGDNGPTRYVLDWLKDGEVVYTLAQAPGQSLAQGSASQEFRGRATHGDDGSLRIRGVRPTDGGTFHCVLKTFDRPAENPHSPRIKLQVQTLPHFTDGREAASSLWRGLGSALELECVADGVPPPRITWTKDGAGLRGDERFELSPDGERLSLAELRVGDEGEFACTASNPVGSVSRTTTLAFPKAAWLDVTPSNLTAIEGSAVLWECHAQAQPADASLEYVWTQADTPVPFSGLALRASRIGSNLSISPVKREDRGWYRCAASNGHGPPASAAAFLDVHYEAEVSRLTSAIQHLPLGIADSSIHCRIEANPPASFVNWAKEGRVIDARDPAARHYVSDNGSRLHFRNASKEDAGIYSCQAYNSVGGSGAFEVHVLVQEPPFFVLEPEPLTRREIGEEAELRCAGSGRPQPAVFWKRADNAALPPEARQTNVDGVQVLTFRKLKPAHHGTYQCVVQNRVTSLTRDALVQVHDTPPQAPSEVTVISGAFDAKISWTAGFDGGHPPTEYTLLYREAAGPSPQPWRRKEVGSATSTTLAFLHPDVVYEYQIQPRNALGPGFPSKPVQVRTLGYQGIGKVLPTDSTGSAYFPALNRPIGPRPGAPRNLRIRENHQGELELGWEAPRSSQVPVYYYAVEFKPNLDTGEEVSSGLSGDGFKQLRGTVKDTRVGLDAGMYPELEGGTTYDLRVRSHSLAAYSLPSKPVQWTTPGGSPMGTALVAGLTAGLSVGLLLLALVCCLIARRWASGKSRRAEYKGNGVPSAGNGRPAVSKPVYECGDGGFGTYHPPPKLRSNGEVRFADEQQPRPTTRSASSTLTRSRQHFAEAPRAQFLDSRHSLLAEHKGRGEPNGVAYQGLSELEELMCGARESQPCGVPPSPSISLAGPPVPLYRSSALAGAAVYSVSKAKLRTLADRATAPCVRPAEEGATKRPQLNNVSDLLDQYNSDSLERLQRPFGGGSQASSETSEALDFTPLGQSGYLIRRPSQGEGAAGYSRDRLLTAIEQLRRNAAAEDQKFGAALPPTIPEEGVTVTSPSKAESSESGICERRSTSPNAVSPSAASSSSGFSSSELAATANALNAALQERSLLVKQGHWPAAQGAGEVEEERLRRLRDEFRLAKEAQGPDGRMRLEVLDSGVL